MALPVTILDISTGGLCAEHPQPLEPGSLCSLCLHLPERSEDLRLQARVKWTQPLRVERRFGAGKTVYRSGFQFLKVGPEALGPLERYVAARFAGMASAELTATVCK